MSKSEMATKERRKELMLVLGNALASDLETNGDMDVLDIIGVLLGLTMEIHQMVKERDFPDEGQGRMR